MILPEIELEKKRMHLQSFLQCALLQWPLVLIVPFRSFWPKNRKNFETFIFIGLCVVDQLHSITPN